jgi:site-specific DNA-methyltransferase (adenine-specific)
MISEVYNRDCLEAMREMPDKAFSLAIADPPYGIGMGERKRNNNLCGFEIDTRFAAFNDQIRPSEEYFKELRRVSVNQIIWGGNYFCDLLPVSRGWIFWDKSPIVPNYSDGELAWSSFDRILKRKLIYWNGKCRTGTEPLYKCIHPTQKPVALYKWLLTNYAKQGDTILDTHLGSQSSRIAAWDLGFDFVGYELDADYYEAGCERFERHRAQGTLFTPEPATIEQEALPL